MALILWFPYSKPALGGASASVDYETMKRFHPRIVTITGSLCDHDCWEWWWVVSDVLLGLDGGTWRCIAGSPRREKDREGGLVFQSVSERDFPVTSDLDENGACRCGCGYQSSWERNRTNLQGDAV